MLDCIIQRLTAVESQLYIRDKLKIEVGIDYIKKDKIRTKEIHRNRTETLTARSFCIHTTILWQSWRDKISPKKTMGNY